jgi:Peptidase M16 inactive domain
MAGDVDLGAEGPKLLRDTYDASMSVALEARKETKNAEFAYASDAAKAGAIASKKHVDEFDFEDVIFENGVKLHVKKTDFKEKQILISAEVGEGRLSLDRGTTSAGASKSSGETGKKSDSSGGKSDSKGTSVPASGGKTDANGSSSEPNTARADSTGAKSDSTAASAASNAVNALDWVASQIFIACALGKHSDDDLRRLNAGKEVGVDFSIDADTFHFTGATTKEDLVRQCELMRAYLVDPGWRAEGLEQFKKGLPVVYDSIGKQPSGPLTTKFLPEFYSDAPRMQFPTRESAEAVTTDAIRAWLAPQFKDAPIDVVIVGDVDVDAAVRAVAQTFGTLEKRREPRRYEENRTPTVLRTGLRRDYEIESNVPKAFVLILFPATDGREARTRRSIGFFTQILRDRLRVDVREKLGAAYSPSAGATLSEVYPDDGWIGIQTESEIDKADAMVDACLKVADGMNEHHVTEEEFDRQRQPTLAAIRDQLRTNAHWQHALSLLHSKDHVLEEMRAFPTFLKDLNPADMDAIAKEYLKRDRACVAVVVPSNAGGPAKDSETPAPKKKE